MREQTRWLGFTLIELMIVIAILAMIVALLVNTVDLRPSYNIGDAVVIKAYRDKKAVVVSYDVDPTRTYTVRIDNGPESSPRFSEVRFFPDELEPAPEKR
jgi:prepilin-type N-terminal cleavage/methylation domain-containing protein